MKTKTMHFVKWRKGSMMVEMEYETFEAARELAQDLLNKGIAVTMRSEERRFL